MHRVFLRVVVLLVFGSNGGAALQPSPESDMVDLNSTNDLRLSIRVAIVGCVSTGKSTLLNALLGVKLSDTRIRRNTMLPNVYKEMNASSTKLSLRTSAKACLENNRNINQAILQNRVNLTGSSMREIHYVIPKMYDFLRLGDGLPLDLYDIPGIDDAKTSNIYYNYIDHAFDQFNVIIMVVDITESFNTDASLSLLRRIADNARLRPLQPKHVVVIANKCDHMEVLSNGTLRFHDTELVEMYQQMTDTVHEQLKGMIHVRYSIHRMSAQDTFAYRAYQRDPSSLDDVEDRALLDRMGANEFGRRKWSTWDVGRRMLRMKHVLSSNDAESALRVSGYVAFRQYMTEAVGQREQQLFLISNLLHQLNHTIESSNNNDDMYTFEDVHTAATQIDRVFCRNKRECNDQVIWDIIDQHCQTCTLEQLMEQLMGAISGVPTIAPSALSVVEMVQHAHVHAYVRRHTPDACVHVTNKMNIDTHTAHRVFKKHMIHTIRQIRPHSSDSVIQLLQTAIVSSDTIQCECIQTELLHWCGRKNPSDPYERNATEMFAPLLILLKKLVKCGFTSDDFARLLPLAHRRTLGRWPHMGNLGRVVTPAEHGISMVHDHPLVQYVRLAATLLPAIPDTMWSDFASTWLYQVVGSFPEASPLQDIPFMVFRTMLDWELRRAPKSALTLDLHFVNTYVISQLGKTINTQAEHLHSSYTTLTVEQREHTISLFTYLRDRKAYNYHHIPTRGIDNLK